MWTYRCDAPLIDIWPVSLNLLVSAGSSVPIMPSGYIDSVIYYTSSCISHTFKVKTERYLSFLCVSFSDIFLKADILVKNCTTH